MEQNCLFSVLIANFNNGRYLLEAIESVKKQTYTNWQIVIVDDYSIDNSKELYHSMENDSRIKIYYNDKNHGVGYTKKRCIDVAEGEICGFLDPDDALVPEALFKMVEVHRANPEVSLVHSRLYICDENLKVISASQTSKEVAPGDPYFFAHNGIISHFASFKKKSYLETEGLDTYLKRAIDADLYMKLYEVGPTRFLDELLYYYRIHKGGISTNENIDKALYWHWVAIINAGRRRNLNLEDYFYKDFVRTHSYHIMWVKYTRLKKYEKINVFLSRINSRLRKMFGKEVS